MWFPYDWMIDWLIDLFCLIYYVPWHAHNFIYSWFTNPVSWWRIRDWRTRYVSTHILFILYTCFDSNMCMIASSIHWFSHWLSCQLHFISRDPFRDLEGCYGLYRTFPISNLTPEPDLVFHRPPFPKQGVTFRVFLSYFVYPF